MDLVLAATSSAGEVAQSAQLEEEGFFFEVFGERIRLLFFKEGNGVKLLLSVLLLLALGLLRWAARAVAHVLQRRCRH